MTENEQLRAILYPLLKKNPDHMFVTDEIIAVMMPDEHILVIGGDFKGISEEDANLRLQEALRKMQ